MAVTRITYDATKIGGDLVAKAVDRLREARDYLTRAKAMMDTITDGGLTKTNLESSAEFGVAVGKGAAFYDAVNDMKTNAATVSDAAIGAIDAGD